MDDLQTPREAPWWHDAKNLMMAILTGTYCLLMVLVVVSWLVVGPERVPQVAREAFVDLLKVMLGVIAGYLIGRSNGKQPPAVPAAPAPRAR